MVRSCTTERYARGRRSDRARQTTRRANPPGRRLCGAPVGDGRRSVRWLAPAAGCCRNEDQDARQDAGEDQEQAGRDGARAAPTGRACRSDGGVSSSTEPDGVVVSVDVVSVSVVSVSVVSVSVVSVSVVSVSVGRRRRRSSSCRSSRCRSSRCRWSRSSSWCPSSSCPTSSSTSSSSRCRGLGVGRLGRRRGRRWSWSSSRPGSRGSASGRRDHGRR